MSSRMFVVLGDLQDHDLYLKDGRFFMRHREERTVYSLEKKVARSLLRHGLVVVLPRPDLPDWTRFVLSAWGKRMLIEQRDLRATQAKG